MLQVFSQQNACKVHIKGNFSNLDFQPSALVKTGKSGSGAPEKSEEKKEAGMFSKLGKVFSKK